MPWLDLHGDIERDLEEVQHLVHRTLRRRDPLWHPDPPPTPPTLRAEPDFDPSRPGFRPFRAAMPPQVRFTAPATYAGMACDRCGQPREMREGTRMPIQCQCWRKRGAA